MADWQHPPKELVAFEAPSGASVITGEANPLPVSVEEDPVTEPTARELLVSLLDAVNGLRFDIRQLSQAHITTRMNEPVAGDSDLIED